jgi:lysophospholipase L1-like esterase
MTIIKEKIWVLTIGILAAFILLELGLRITSSLYMRDRQTNSYIAEEGAYTILCLGNSWTLGVGAPAGMSYPDYLQHMLKHSFPDREVKVINAGGATLNSAELLFKLEAQIDSIKPDLIVLRTGSPNMWNTYKYSQYLNRKYNIQSPFRILALSLNDFFYEKSRVCRLVLFMLKKDSYIIKSAFKGKHKIHEYEDIGADRQSGLDFQTGNSLHTQLLSEKGYQDAIALAISFNRELIQIFLGGKDMFNPVSGAEFEEAISWLKKATEYQPEAWHNYALLGNLFILKKDYNKAAEFYIEGIKADPRPLGKEYLDNMCYLLLRSLYSMDNNLDVQNKIELFVHEYSMKNPDMSDILLSYVLNPFTSQPNYITSWLGQGRRAVSMLDNHSLAAWIASDVDEIVRITRANGVKLIIHSYPPPFKLSEEPLLLANSVLRKKAKELKIPFVDHERLFLELYAQGQEQSDYHEKISGEPVPGSHFNEKGYEAMARFVYDKIIEEGFISNRN